MLAMCASLRSGSNSAEGDVMIPRRRAANGVGWWRSSRLELRGNTVIHESLDLLKANVLDEVVVHERRHNREGHGAGRLADDLQDFRVLQAHDILPVNLDEVVADEEAVPCCGGVLHDGLQ